MAAVPSIGRASLLEAGSAAPEATATHDLFERHGARIHGYCLRQLGSREEAEDAVQTTFMNAFGALRRGVVPEAEAAWLFKIAENVCLSRRRSSWRRGRIESPADFGVIEAVVASPETRRDELIGIEDALAGMPTLQRRAILLREWQGLSYREIAAELDLTQAAVETLIFRARRSLARGLTEPEVVKPRRRGLRKALRVGDIASFFFGAKALLGGSAAANAAVAAVTVAAVAGVTARPASEIVPDTVKAPPVPVVVKTTPPTRAVAAQPVRRAGQPTPPVAQEQELAPASVEPTAVAKVAPAVAKRKQAAPQARVAPPRAVPAQATTVTDGPADTSPAAPGREISETRQDVTGKPDTTPSGPARPATPPEPAKPPKPAQAATSNKPATPDKPNEPAKPAQAATPNKTAKTDKSDEPTSANAAAPPKADAAKEQPPTSNRPDAPPGKPEQEKLQAASRPPAEPEAEEVTEPERGPKREPAAPAASHTG